MCVGVCVCVCVCVVCAGIGGWGRAMRKSSSKATSCNGRRSKN